MAGIESNTEATGHYQPASVRDLHCRPAPARVAVFVDGANFYYMQRDKLQWWIDCRKLLEYIREDFGVVTEAIYYSGKSTDDSSQGADQPSNEDSFRHLLLKLGYALRSKPVREMQADGDVRRKANMDVEVTLDMVTMQNLYDIAVLVSGDGDFVCLVEYLQRQGKQVVILSTSGLIAHQLREVVGRHYVDVAFLEDRLRKQE